MSLMDVFSTSLSGMNAADRMLNVAASNLANLNSQGFKAARVNLVSGPGGGTSPGVQVQSVTTDPSPGYIDDTGTEMSNSDPASDVVHTILARQMYNANAMVVRTADHMLGSLLDVMSDDRDRDRH